MGDRLESWKEIAAYLGRESRTVQRWEAERNFPVHRLPGGDKPRVFAMKSEVDAWLLTSGEQQRSVAVLPFVSLSGDKENEYFSDGLADDIINALTRVDGLRVTARTSSFAFRGKEQDVRQVGARLGVSALLEGSVRREANRVRVSAQLVSAENGFHLWSETYDRQLTDIFAIQNDIAASIARALQARVGPAPLVRRWTEDAEAYRLWMKGRYAGARWTPEAMAEAMTHFQAALARDPHFPLPYLAVAELLLEASWFGFAPPLETGRRAKQAVTAALSIDDSLGEAHAVLGSLLAGLEYDWAGAGREFERALELSPGSPMVLYRHAWFFLTPKMRLSEAVEGLRRTTGLDPLSPLLHGALGLVLLEAREFEAAEEECRVAVELAPAMWWSRFFLACTLVAQRKTAEAVELVRGVIEQLRGASEAAGAMCLTYGLCGRREDALRMFAAIEQTVQTSAVSPLSMAWACLGVGDERVFDWLACAIDGRYPAVTHLPGMPIYDSIRSDPRFLSLVEKMGLQPAPGLTGARGV